MKSRELALVIAEELLFKPYIWGGNDPNTGYDCSGFVIEVLQSVGKLPYKYDGTANDLYTLYKAHDIQSRESLKSGCLVFYGNPIIHVEIVYGVLLDTNNILTIGSMGGGSHTITLEDSKAQDAYVKIRPIKANWSHAVDPFYGDGN